MLADNKLTDRSSWDDDLVAIQLKELSELALDFDIQATGFEAPEIDFRIQSLESLDGIDRADDFQLASGQPASAVQFATEPLGGHSFKNLLFSLLAIAVACGPSLGTKRRRSPIATRLLAPPRLTN